jgi:hypothetical protein
VHCQCRMLSYLAPTSRKSLNVQVVTTRCDTVMKPCKPVFKRRRRRRSDEERPFRRWVAELQLASVQAQLIGPEQSEQRPMGFCSLNRKKRSNRKEKQTQRTNETTRTGTSQQERERGMYSGCVCFAWLQARAAIRASVAAEPSDAGRSRPLTAGWRGGRRRMGRRARAAPHAVGVPGSECIQRTTAPTHNRVNAQGVT